MVICLHYLLVGWLIGHNKPTNQHTNQPLFVGPNRPYDQPLSNRLIIELKCRGCNNFQCLEIYVQANFSIKRAYRCLHIHTASVRKINEVNLIASCVLGHPKYFRRPQTTCRHPTLQSREDVIFLYCRYILYMYKFYDPNNHINYPDAHSWIIKITIYTIKKLPLEVAVSHILII